MFPSERAIAWTARLDPDRLAIFENGVGTSYLDLENKVEELANWLRGIGVSEGSVVSVWMPVWWEATAAFNAILRVGAVADSMSNQLGDDQVLAMLDLAQPLAVFVGAESAAANAKMDDLLERGAIQSSVYRVRASETSTSSIPVKGECKNRTAFNRRSLPGAAALIFTSGTTDTPKGILHGNNSLDATCLDVAERFGLGESSNIGMASPIGHIRWVVFGATLPFILGGTLLTSARWNGKDWIGEANATNCQFAAFSPKHLSDVIALHNAGIRARTLKTISCGGSCDISPEAPQGSRGDTGRAYRPVLWLHGISECDRRFTYGFGC